MDDRTLLELAAKAAGIEYNADKSKPHPVSNAFFGLWLVIHHEPYEGQRRYWNPLRDDGDALRLVVSLKLHIGMESHIVSAWQADRYGNFHTETLGKDEQSATRRAIVRAAAAIGGQGK